MTTRRHTQVLQQLRQAVLAHDGAGLTDAELMSHFVARRDGAALEALIRRHGSMVWSVCRRVLANEQDAEDAFQASFLVFVRKAASIRARAQVGAWLYSVAYRTALKARGVMARRRDRERRAAAMTPTQTETDESWTELLPLLDQELARLPDKYRAAIVLCELEGRPRKEAARQLGIPEGTLSSRLATGRRMLAKRFGRPGLALSAGAIAAASAAPPTLMASTVKALSMVAAGQATVAGAVTLRVASLAEGVIKAMFLSKLTVGAALLAVVAVLAAGTGTTVYSEQAGRPDTKPPTPPVAAVRPEHNKEDKKEVKKEDSEWGDAVDGVQARVRVSKVPWDAGAAPTFILDLHNQGDKAVLLFRQPEDFEIEMDGVWYSKLLAFTKHISYPLEPGSQINNWVVLVPDNRWVSRTPGASGEPESFTLTIGKHTVRVGYPLGREKVVSQSVKIEAGLESAWGEAVAGIQARIRAPRRVWGKGETPTFILDLRNQGKKTPKGRRAPYDCSIEVDKVWYRHDESAPPYLDQGDPLKAGAQVNNWTDVLATGHWTSGTAERKRLELPPGTHTIRISCLLQDTTLALGPASGPLEIEIDGPPEIEKNDRPLPKGAKAPPGDKRSPGFSLLDSSMANSAIIRKRLGDKIHYELSVDTTLDKALDQLLARNEIPWTVNDAAFGADNTDIAKNTAVEKINEVEGVTRAAVLKRLLAKMPNDGAKTAPIYLIRPDHIEITTQAAYLAEFYPGRKPRPAASAYLPPLAYAVFDQVPLSEALAELAYTTEGNVVVAGYAAKDAETKVTARLTGVPLDAAVALLADMADLKCVRVGNVYYVTTRERARLLEKDEQEGQRRP